MLTSPIDTTGQAAPIEDPTRQNNTVESADSKTEEALSPKFAALAKKERLLREEDRRVKSEREALKLEREKIKAEIEASWKERIAKEPMNVMREAGLTYDQIADDVMKQPSAESLELKQLRQELETLKKSQEQKDADNTTQSQKQLRWEVDALVKDNSAYEAIQSYDAFDAVVELIEEVRKSDGYRMKVEDAAKEVEEHLVEEALSAAKLKKVQERLSPPQAATEAVKQDPSKQQPMSTLSNKAAPITKPMNAKERRERAIQAFKGTL